MHRIAAYKTYTNLPGYDLIAVDPDHHRSARIQVKSRWRTGAPGFLIKNFDCDFVVVVRLNRGSKTGRGRVLAPDFFVFPTDVIKSAHKPGVWSKVFFRDIPNLETYREQWGRVQEFLSG